jgi:hypothetical protein
VYVEVRSVRVAAEDARVREMDVAMGAVMEEKMKWTVMEKEQ